MGAMKRWITRQPLVRERALIVLGLLAVLTALASAARQGVTQLETSTLHAIYHWPASIKPAFFVATQLGSGWMVLIVCTAAYMHLRLKDALKLSVAAGSTFVLVELMKHLIARPRPYAFDASISKRDLWTQGGFGFPSGHAALATVVACFLASKISPKYRPLLAFGVILVAVSRIYLGMHYIFDVLGGICMGAMVGVWLYGAKLLAKPNTKA